MHWTLNDIANNPDSVTSFDSFGSTNVCFRPLLPDDSIELAKFFNSLGPETRLWSTRDGYDLHAAQQLCNDINRYDKLRLVALIDNELIVALFELSLTIMDEEYLRFAAQYKIVLNDKTDARFGPCISDEYQNRQLGRFLFEKTKAIASKMGIERLILWGGVFTENHRAIKFYKSVGFHLFSQSFRNHEQLECFDGIHYLS